MLKFIHKKIKYIEMYLFQIISTLSLSCIIGHKLSLLAYAERGIFGVGGEWILIILTVIILWNITKYCAKKYFQWRYN